MNSATRPSQFSVQILYFCSGRKIFCTKSYFVSELWVYFSRHKWCQVTGFGGSSVFKVHFQQIEMPSKSLWWGRPLLLMIMMTIILALSLHCGHFIDVWWNHNILQFLPNFQQVHNFGFLCRMKSIGHKVHIWCWAKAL